MDFVSIDLETTGLNPKLDKIIEIGAVKVKNGVEKSEFSSLINPGRRLDERISSLTKITDKDLETAPYIEDVFGELMEFLEDLPLVGHRILFDYSFLKKEAVLQGISFEKNGIDTLKIARKYLAGLEHKNLGFLCDNYEIPINAHRAIGDAKATASLYERLVRDFYCEEDKLFSPAPLIFKVKKDPPASKVQRERYIKLLKLHNETCIYDIERMSKSEISRQTDLLLSKYGEMTKNRREN